MSYSSNAPSKNQNDTMPLVTQILALLSKVANRFDKQESEEWQWLTQHSHNPEVIEVLRDSTLVTLRVLDAIGRLEPVNGITISEQFRIPKGTVSKITRRLLARKLIANETLPNNKKEILFRLTPFGKEVFQVHRTFDEQMERGFVQFLQRYDAAELGLLVRVLQESLEASFLTLGLEARDAEKTTNL